MRQIKCKTEYWLSFGPHSLCSRRTSLIRHQCLWHVCWSRGLAGCAEREGWETGMGCRSETACKRCVRPRSVFRLRCWCRMESCMGSRWGRSSAGAWAPVTGRAGWKRPRPSWMCWMLGRQTGVVDKQHLDRIRSSYSNNTRRKTRPVSQ